MPHDTLLTYSLIIGLTMLAAGVALNWRLGGGLLELPTHYQPPAFYVYFGGLVIMALGVAVAKIFL